MPTLYISCIYWLWVTKTAAEETSEYATDTVMDLIKYHVNEYDNNVTNHERNAFNVKRNGASVDVSPKEYYYVEELPELTEEVFYESLS